MEAKIAQIKKETIRIVQTYFTEEIDQVLKEIEEAKKTPEAASSPDLIEELNIYRALLLFVEFPTLSEDDQLKLFRADLLKAFKVGIDIKERFALKMNTLDSSLWPETAQLFLEAIASNEEKIGRENIVVEGEKDSSAPLLRNWLRDYNRIYGMEKHDRMVIHRYMTENRNVAKLNQNEKVTLLKAIEFYESLKFPTQSQFLKAFEEYLNQPDSEISLVEEAIGITSQPSDDQNDPLSGFREEMFLGGEGIINDNLRNLMSKFPKIADQEISEKPINLLYNGESVRPTIENWLSDYSSFAGADGREITDRSNYLLRSANTVNLKLEERIRLGLILRSIDESYPLSFSVKDQRIIFNTSG